MKEVKKQPASSKALRRRIKALIIDDEHLARQELRHLLTIHEQIEVVGEAENVSQALRQIEAHRPDLLFLDIQMPRASGFDLLRHLTYPAKVIFITAYDRYALRAFEVNALDYLLKPINPERLAQSLKRLDKKRQPDLSRNCRLRYEDQLYLNFGRRSRFLALKDILQISAAGDYTEITTTDMIKTLVLKSMKVWETIIPENHFCRIHRSTIVNINYVEKVVRTTPSSYLVYLNKPSSPLRMSRRFSMKLRDKYGLTSLA